MRPPSIGFLAVAYASGALTVVDMRGPSVMLHVEAGKGPQSKWHPLSKPASIDAITSLNWSTCSLRSGTS
jgi:syntaxin-binding protein 5